MARARSDRIVDPQQFDPAPYPWIGGKKGRGKTTVTVEGEQTLHGQQSGFRFRPVRAAEAKMYRRRFPQASYCDIQPDTMPAIGQNGMFPTALPRNDRQPARDPIESKPAGLLGNGRDSDNAERSGIDIGTPDDPGRRCFPSRMFNKSEAPTGPLQQRRHFPARRHMHMPRYKRDRDAAIPT